MKSKKNIIVAIMLITITIAITIFLFKFNDNVKEQVTITTIGEEEIDFYEAIITRNNKYLSSDELRDEVKNYAEEVYAQFYLGEEYGLCNPFSYEALKMSVEAENNNRAARKDSKDVVYGVTNYSLDQFLNYELSNLKLNIVDYLVKNHDINIEKKAKKYFKNNAKDFEEIKTIRYKIGNEIEIADKNSLKMIEKTSPELFENLYNLKIGEKFCVEVNSEIINCEIIDKEMSLLNFNDEKEVVLRRYISDVYYWELVNSVKEFNKIELIND